MIIDELKAVLPINKEVTSKKASHDWASITTLFGKPLPGDYVSLIENYGSGEIGGWLTVFNPFDSNPNISLTKQSFGLLSSISLLKEEFPETCPYPLMFEPGGLLPWGMSIDGDIYCWATNGVSGKWSIVIIGRHSEPEEFPLPMCRFIAQAITGEITPLTVPTEWPQTPVTFTPFN